MIINESKSKGESRIVAVKGKYYVADWTNSIGKYVILSSNYQHTHSEYSNKKDAIDALRSIKEPGRLIINESSNRLNESDGYKRITIELSDPDNGFQDLIDYIKSISSGGHSFDVVVDPSNPNYRKSFDIDGDGSFRISDVEEEKINESKKHKLQRWY